MDPTGMDLYIDVRSSPRSSPPRRGPNFPQPPRAVVRKAQFGYEVPYLEVQDT